MELAYASGRALETPSVEFRRDATAGPDEGWSTWSEVARPEGLRVESRGHVQVRVRLATDDRRVSPAVRNRQAREV
jgi:hypothetical protein